MSNEIKIPITSSGEGPLPGERPDVICNLSFPKWRLRQISLTLFPDAHTDSGGDLGDSSSSFWVTRRSDAELNVEQMIGVPKTSPGLPPHRRLTFVPRLLLGKHQGVPAHPPLVL